LAHICAEETRKKRGSVFWPGLSYRRSIGALQELYMSSTGAI
jgi:hypothetical protein